MLPGPITSLAVPFAAEGVLRLEDDVGDGAPAHMAGGADSRDSRAGYGDQGGCMRDNR